MQRRRGPRHPPCRRHGVILIVVLSLLTLFAIVGIAFQVYGETGRPELREFRVEAVPLLDQTGIMAAVVGHDPRTALRDDVDFSDSLAAIDEMAERTSLFKASVRAAIAGETDSDRRAALLELCDDLEDLQFEVGLLRRLIEILRSRETGTLRPER